MKQLKRRLAALVLVCAMLLAGCAKGGDSPGKGLDRSGGYRFTGHVTLDVSASGGGLIDIGFQAEAEGSGDSFIGHIHDLNMSVTYEGLSTDSSFESWESNEGFWLKSVYQGQDSGWNYYGTDPDGIAAPLAGLPESLIKKSDGKNSWTVGFADVAPALDGLIAGISETAGGAELGTLVATAIYDKTGNLSALSVVSDAAGASGTLEFHMTDIKVFSATGLAVPEEVKVESAREPEESGGDEAEVPKPGGFNEPWSDGSTGILNRLDEGSDEALDSVLASIQANDVGFQILDVMYGAEGGPYAMYNSCSGSDWNGVLHLYSKSTEEARKQVEAWYSEDCGLYGEPYEERVSGDSVVWALWYVPSYDNSFYVAFVGRENGLCLNGGGFDFRGDIEKEQSIKDILQMVDATGLEWGRGE